MRRKIGVDLRRPAFIGIHDDGAFRCTRPYRLKPRHVIRRAQLDLQKRAKGVPGGLRLHLGGRIQRQGIGGDFRPRRGQPGQVPGAFAGPLGLQVPQRAIDGVARRPGGQQIVQRLPAQIPGQIPVQAVDLGRHAVQRLVIARIGHAFTHARMSAVGHPHGQNPGLGPRPAGNGKDLRQPEHIARDSYVHVSPVPGLTRDLLAMSEAPGQTRGACLFRSPPAHPPALPTRTCRGPSPEGPYPPRPGPDTPWHPPRTCAAC